MKRVHASESLADVGHMKNLLEQSGIPCTVRNEQLSGALGEIPFLECLPELWVLEDQAAPKALRLIEEFTAAAAAAAAAAPWRCPACREANEGQFAVCWNCGKADERQ